MNWVREKTKRLRFIPKLLSLCFSPESTYVTLYFYVSSTTTEKTET